LGLSTARAADPPATTSPALPPGAPLTGNAVLRYLDRCIDWYHRVNAIDQPPIDSQELLFRSGARTNAKEALRLAFAFARAEAVILSGRANQSSPTSAPASLAVRIKNAADQAGQRAIDLKNRIGILSRTGKSAADAALQSKLAAELDLAVTERDSLSQYAQYMINSSNSDATLAQRIDELQRTVPELMPSAPADTSKGNDAGNGTDPSTPPAPTQFQPEANGILSLISELFSLTERMSELGHLRDSVIQLQSDCKDLRGPIRAQVIDDFHRAAALGATTQDTTQPITDLAKLDADRHTIEMITADFKLSSAAGFPLGEQSQVLDAALESISSWHDALLRRYELATRSLLTRAIGTALVIILLLVFSELWRRATYRYITDVRRRRQLMFVRRLIVGVIFVLIVIGSVVTEFGSLATFAGLITAGIAVALQTVILSGVAYFFFIGRYGVRIGDRVTVSGITGDVVEIGLFRLYLMELAGPLTDPQPTGRMIVFSNAVLFQPSAFYKQLPGADYTWHEVALTLAPDTDHALAEKRLMAAVQSVFEKYKDSIDRQHQTANEILHVPLEEPRPQSRLRFVDAGMELIIRYPVELEHSSAIEDQVTRAVMEAIQREPKFTLVAAGVPRIQAVR
jgi:small-conductance mechanosensitive channel